MDISIPIWILIFPIIFSFLLYWILKSLPPKIVEQNEVLDFEGNMTTTNYRTHSFWVSIFFSFVFIFSAISLFILMGTIASLAGSSTLIILIPLLILGYGFYNVTMMIRYREPQDYKYWIGYAVISFFTSFVFLGLIVSSF